MDLARAFPDFDEARVVYRGDGLIVVDKPRGFLRNRRIPKCTMICRRDFAG